MAKRGSIEWKQNISRGNAGKVAWNKGLTKETDYRIKKSGELSSKTKRGSIPWNKGLKGLQVAWNKGKPWSKEIKEKISLTIKGRINLKVRGEKHYKWKGDMVKYKPLHAWIRKYKRAINYCEKCKRTGMELELANISRKYKRDLDDYIWLCKSCHVKYDGLIKNLKGGQ